jgi:hypothetical protein
MDEKLHIKDGEVHFERAWLSNPTTSGHPVIFPKHLQQIDKTAKWVRDAIQTYQLISTSPIGEDLVHLSVPPSFTCLAYMVYKNHFRVDDEYNSLLIAYDYGVAFVFQQSQGNEDDVLGVIQYVGTLKEILQLDYGPMFSPIVLFHCCWVKNGTNNRGNPTYKRNDVSFLLANFRHLLHEFDEPFVFPSQVQQVLFWSEPKILWWKVVLYREPKSRRVVANTYDDCMDTCDSMFGLEAPLEFPNLESSRAIVSAIELNREESILVVQALCGNLGIDDVPCFSF